MRVASTQAQVISAERAAGGSEALSAFGIKRDPAPSHPSQNERIHQSDQSDQNS